MNVEKAICMVLYNRPQYSRRVLEALSRCTGIAEYVIIPCVEPGNEENRALVKAISFAECRPVFNRRILGCNANIHQALSKGFELADFVILVEDDVLCARDALGYYEYCRRRYRDDHGILSVTGYNRSQSCPPESYHEIRRRQWFIPWSCAFWKDRWELIAPGWPRRWSGVSWDIRVNNEFCQPRKLQEIYPLLSRTQNIGAESGVHVPSAEWHHQNQHVPFWAEDIHVPPGEFREKES